MRLKKVNKTYHVCFKSDDGTPMEVDTGCADYTEAKAVAWKSKAAELEQVAKVMRLTSDIVSRIVTGKEMTMNLALGRYKVWARNNLTNRTAGSHISYVSKWIKDFNLEKVTPASIEDNMVSGWVNSQGKGDENLKASTRRVRKAALKSFLDYCYNKGWMLTRPADLCRVQMDKMTHQQKETKSHAAMSDEDLKALMKEADAFWKMAIHLASVTGLRLGDVCSLEWACFDGNTVTVWTDKRDKRISVRVPASVINAMCSLPVSDPTYLFPDKRELYLDANRRAGLSVQFKRLCNKAAEKSGRNSLKKKSFHGLRSYYAKNKQAKGVKIETIAKDLGHSSTKTTDVYLNAKP